MTGLEKVSGELNAIAPGFPIPEFGESQSGCHITVASVLLDSIYLATTPLSCDNDRNAASIIRSFSQVRTTWEKRSVLSRPARVLHKAGITPSRFRLKNRKRYGKAFKGGKRSVTALSSAPPIAVSMPGATSPVQLDYFPSQSSSAYSSSSGGDCLLERTVMLSLSGYIRDRVSAGHGNTGGEDEHEKRGDDDSNNVGSGITSSTNADDDGPNVPGGDITGGGRNYRTRPGGSTDTTPVEGRAADDPSRSTEETDPFSERFVGSRKGCGEGKEPL